MNKTLLILLAILFLAGNFINAQEKEKEKIKKDWTFGLLPAFGYDPNTGYKYGGMINFYNYGDGTRYPRYDHCIHLELSRTTKGTGVNQLTFDSNTLIPGIRVLAETSLLTEKTLNFYGFNGYNAYYNAGFENNKNALYRSKVFYRMERSMIKLKLEFIGKLNGNNLKWFGGLEYLNNKLDTVDIGNLNNGKDPEDLLPPVGGGLYGDFIKWELIPHDQANGGSTCVFKFGAKFDTRERETNPMSGLWTELQFLVVPAFLGDGFGYTRFAFTHRQYLTLIPKKVSLAYRLSYQAKLSGEMPFYMLPLVYNSAPQLTLSGLGGATTIRGILRNRVVGEDFFYSNAEVRWKVFRTIILNQNFYLALAGFADAGMVTGKYKLPSITNSDAIAWLAKGDKEKLHIGYGAGVHFAINENFIITVDRAYAADPRDGSGGTYIGLNFLF
jgi:hypothetical protein